MNERAPDSVELPGIRPPADLRDVFRRTLVPLLADPRFVDGIIDRTARELVDTPEDAGQVLRHVEIVARHAAGRTVGMLTGIEVTGDVLCAGDHSFVDLILERDAPLEALEEGYRLGYHVFLAQATAAVSRDLRDSDLLPRAVVALSEAVQSNLAAQLGAMRELYTSDARSAVAQRDAVRVWSNDVLRHATAEDFSGFRLDAPHGCVLLWDEGDPADAGRRIALALDALAPVVESARQYVLTHPSDLVVRIWLDQDRIADSVRDALASAPGHVWAAVGGPYAGVDGFRNAAYTADSARSLSVLTDPRVRERVTVHADWPVLSLLAGYPRRLPALVHDVLGDLAADDEHARQCRSAVLAYHLSSRSLGAAAATLFVHKNTLQKRLDAAQRLALVDIRQPSVDLLVALQVTDRLAAPVLRETGEPDR